MVDDEGVSDNSVHGPICARGLSLAHAVADDFAAAEFDLFTIGGEVFFYLDNQVGVSEAELVAGSWAVHVGIGSAGDLGGHGLSTLGLQHRLVECVRAFCECVRFRQTCCVLNFCFAASLFHNEAVLFEFSLAFLLALSEVP